MQNEFRITLEMETPLFTGGILRTMDRVHGTSLVGSLRWWYEALLRAYGGDACNPVDQRCTLDPEEPQKVICAACQTFGTTGWGRRFRLAVTEHTYKETMPGRVKTTGDRYKRQRNPGDGREHPEWYFPDGYVGQVELDIIPLSPDFDPMLLRGLLQLIANHAGLAAKTQLGYGDIHIAGAWAPLDQECFLKLIQGAATLRPGSNPGLPNLKEMFFAELRVPPDEITGRDGDLSAGLNLRFDLRNTFRQAPLGTDALRHFIMGTVRGEREAAKIKIGHVLDKKIRVWGWVPNGLPGGARRAVVVEAIHKKIGGDSRTKGFGEIESWREFDSPFDTEEKEQKNFDTYLISLLKGVTDEH